MNSKINCTSGFGKAVKINRIFAFFGPDERLRSCRTLTWTWWPVFPRWRRNPERPRCFCRWGRRGTCRAGDEAKAARMRDVEEQINKRRIKTTTRGGAESWRPSRSDFLYSALCNETSWEFIHVASNRRHNMNWGCTICLFWHILWERYGSRLEGMIMNTLFQCYAVLQW